MTLIQKIYKFLEHKNNPMSSLRIIKIKLNRFNPLFILVIFVFFSTIFFIISSFVYSIHKENKNNLEEITKSSEFYSLTEYVASKINSPYEEVSYVIKNNDTMEKILKNFNIKNSDIKSISAKLKEKKFNLFLLILLII